MPSVEVILYLGAIGLSIIGLAGILMVNNVFRLVLSIVILEAGANLLLILSGFREGGIAPILLSSAEGTTGQMTAIMNDPVPQALVLTAIVIGVGVQALALALIIRIKHQYGTLNMKQIRDAMENDIAHQAGVATPASAHAPQYLQNREAGH